MNATPAKLTSWARGLTPTILVSHSLAAQRTARRARDALRVHLVLGSPADARLAPARLRLGISMRDTPHVRVFGSSLRLFLDASEKAEHKHVHLSCAAIGWWRNVGCHMMQPVSCCADQRYAHLGQEHTKQKCRCRILCRSLRGRSTSI